MQSVKQYLKITTTTTATTTTNCNDVNRIKNADFTLIDKVFFLDLKKVKRVLLGEQQPLAPVESQDQEQ
jgi:hypothetical protein